MNFREVLVKQMQQLKDDEEKLKNQLMLTQGQLSYNKICQDRTKALAEEYDKEQKEAEPKIVDVKSKKK